MSRYGEFDLIARIRAGVSHRDDVILGIGDDAALLQVPPGKLLVVATDTLNSGVHFPEETAPADIGWKALAVNLSDLAAMGAEPAWCTLSLSLPDADVAWLDGFLDGFLELANRYRVALVGGDITRGPLSICVTAHGFVDAEKNLRRGAAKVGDDIWVTGTMGDAAAALAQWKSGNTIDPLLRLRLDRPMPRIETGLAITGLAHACIDISDGLLADLGHVCVASGVGADIDVDALPSSTALLSLFDLAEQRHPLQMIGGDDYELCFTASADARDVIADISEQCGVAMTYIGRIVEGEGVRALLADGSEWTSRRVGYVHFA